MQWSAYQGGGLVSVVSLKIIRYDVGVCYVLQRPRSSVLGRCLFLVLISLGFHLNDRMVQRWLHGWHRKFMHIYVLSERNLKVEESRRELLQLQIEKEHGRVVNRCSREVLQTGTATVQAAVRAWKAINSHHYAGCHAKQDSETSGRLPC